MVKETLILRKRKKIVLLILAFLPFGVLPKLALGFNVMDALLVILMAFGFVLPRKSWGFLTAAVFSLFFGWLLGIPYSAASALYLVRLVGVINLMGVIGLLVKKKKIKTELLINSLLVVGVVILVTGLLQYLVWPDLRALKAWGWDDHYYRLVGTFLDPGFAGILLVLSLLIAFWQKKRGLVLAFLVGVGLTYSRASFLALWVGMGYFFYRGRDQAWAVALVVLMFIMVPLLPRPGGEGVKLTRTASIDQRWVNAQEGWQILKKYPVFGVGYNNLCQAKEGMGFEAGGHSCSGLDNSFLFVLATTGVLGLVTYMGMGFRIWQESGVAVRASLVAVFAHSMFHNTLFYLWVMIWIAILTASTKR